MADRLTIVPETEPTAFAGRDGEFFPILAEHALRVLADGWSETQPILANSSMALLLLNLYLHSKKGELLNKKEAWTKTGAEDVKTGRKYVGEAEKLGLVKVERSTSDRRKELVVPTPALVSMVEKALAAHMLSVLELINKARHHDAMTRHLLDTGLTSKDAQWFELDNFSRGEYGLPIQSILAQEDELAFKRMGRLLGVWVKSPFAQPSPYDPKRRSNWAQTSLTWKIQGPCEPGAVQRHHAQLEFLTTVADEWNRPIETVHEYHVFHSLCRRLLPILSDPSEVFKNADKIAENFANAGADGAFVSPKILHDPSALAVADYFVTRLPYLAAYGPVVVVFTILAMRFGQQKLCSLLADFERSYEADRDALAGREFALCGSLATINEHPCQNRVNNPSERCWIHA